MPLDEVTAARGIAFAAARVTALALLALDADPTRAIAELERAGEQVEHRAEISPVAVAQEAINSAAQELGR